MKVRLKKKAHGMAEIYLDDIKLIGLVSYTLKEDTADLDGPRYSEVTMTIISTDVDFMT